MKCPVCGNNKSGVFDTRIDENGEVLRRRECTECLTRFKTRESAIYVIPPRYARRTKKKECVNHEV